MALLTDDELADYTMTLGPRSAPLMTHIRQLTRDLEAARARIKMLEDAYATKVIDLKAEIAVTEQRIIELRYQQSSDKRENERLAHDLAEAKAENDRLTSEDESLTQQLVNVLRHLAEAKAEIAGLQNRLDDQECNYVSASSRICEQGRYGCTVKHQALKRENERLTEERDKFFDQLSLILNSDSQAVDWEASLETNETPPRPVRVTGKSKGAIDYVVVEIYGEGTSTGSQFDNPNGEYSASKQGGFIRGRLAVRNKFGLAELRRENEAARARAKTVDDAYVIMVRDLAEAKAEIERWRGLWNESDADHDSLVSIEARLKRENERLTEALRYAKQVITYYTVGKHEKTFGPAAQWLADTEALAAKT